VRRFWTSTGAALVLAVGAVAWAAITMSGPAPDNDPAAADRGAPKAAALLDAGLTQARHQDFTRAKSTFERVLEVDPGNAIAWYNLGVLAQGEGRRDDALAAYGAALKSDAAHSSALFNMALLLETSDPDKALALLRRAVSANPRASTAQFHIGAVLARQGHEEQAVDAYRRAVTIDPSLRSQVPERFRKFPDTRTDRREIAEQSEIAETPGR
jgi:Tfp pilus assembly protein PilF